MGYRSEVVVALDKEIIMKNLVLPHRGYTLLVEYADENEDKGDYVIFVLNDIKWYDSYPEKRLIQKFLEGLPDDKYGYIRIGEELNDIEERGEPYTFEMYVHQDISY